MEVKWVKDGATFYREALELSKEYSGSVVEIADKKGVLPIAMYFRAIELVESISALDELGKLNAATILCRSFLELHVDFVLLSENPSYVDLMRRNELTGEIEMEKSFGNTDTVLELEQEKEELKERGVVKKTRIDQKFGMSEHLPKHFYNGVYRSLCMETHNSSRSILCAHARKLESTWRLGPGVGMTDGKYAVVRKQVALTLCMMSKILILNTNVGDLALFDNLVKKYK